MSIIQLILTLKMYSTQLRFYALLTIETSSNVLIVPEIFLDVTKKYGMQ